MIFIVPMIMIIIKSGPNDLYSVKFSKEGKKIKLLSLYDIVL